MIQVIFIPVVFVCLNGQCNFAQSTHHISAAACQTALQETIKTARAMAAAAGQSITQLKGTCVTAKNGML